MHIMSILFVWYNVWQQVINHRLKLRFKTSNWNPNQLQGRNDGNDFSSRIRICLDIKKISLICNHRKKVSSYIFWVHVKVVGPIEKMYETNFNNIFSSLCMSKGQRKTFLKEIFWGKSFLGNRKSGPSSPYFYHWNHGKWLDNDVFVCNSFNWFGTKDEDVNKFPTHRKFCRRSYITRWNEDCQRR